jgi:heptose I phosphotransferase
MERFFAAAGYEKLLSSNGLRDFSSVMNYGGGEVLKRKRNRSITRLVLGEGEERIPLYLKRHRPLLRDRFPFPFRRSSAMREWEGIRRVREAGILTMEPVAFGERRRFGMEMGSFTLTRGVEGGERLEDLLPRRFTPPVPARRVAEKRALIRSISLLVRSLHGAGLHHRDLYLCHVFLRAGPEEGSLLLIDLQRVGARARDANRWVVKDLAALQYSAPPEIVTRSDRVRFLKGYLGLDRLDRRAKGLARRVIRKARRVAAHDAKLRLRRRT